MALPALASTMLLVVTNHVCQDIAVIPFLWVLPLSLYLISFIVCFDSPQWYKPKWIAAATLIAILSIQVKHMLPGSVQLLAEASSYMLMLLGVCLLCHGEVARLKPQSSLLTQYYMLLSAGGAIGGVIVAIACPMLLSTHIEVPFSLALVSALTAIMFFACRGWKETQYDWTAAYRLRFAAIALMFSPQLAIAFAPSDEVIASERNFFGVLQVLRDEEGVRLVHGTTVHGLQFNGENAQEPTSYYRYHSGIAKAIKALQDSRPSIRIGVIGLGCGVLAAYGRESDEFDMIEINPAVVDIAYEHFTFLSCSPATIRTHLGDGRLVLERMSQDKFDLLVLDAFSSDAIPAHLLTREAIKLYRQRLAKDGVLVIHVSNNHLDLVPLVHRLSADAGLESRAIQSAGDDNIGTKRATWTVIAPSENEIWNHESMQGSHPASKSELVDAPLWTDQRHNLVSVLRLW
jgi:spermidine synthase